MCDVLKCLKYVCVCVYVTQVTEDEVLQVLERVLVNNNSLLVSKEYCINAIVKLSTRFSASAQP